MELVELQASDVLSSTFSSCTTLIDFYRQLPNSQFPLLLARAKRVIAMFCSSYSCEQLLSKMTLYVFIYLFINEYYYSGVSPQGFKTTCGQEEGKERRKSSVFRARLKAGSEVMVVRRRGSLFHALAAVAEKARSPRDCRRETGRRKA